MLRSLVRRSSLITILAVATMLLTPGLAAAQSRAAVCEGVGTASGTGSCAGGTGSVNNVIREGVEILSVLVGVAGVVMVLVGSFKLITSNGDAGKVASGRSAIVYALVGLVIAAMAQVIIRFVIDRATQP